MTLQQNLSNTMKAIRSIRKISITEFSEEIGVSRSEAQGILRGTSNPRLDTIQCIADNLNIDPLVLISSFSETQLEVSLLLLKSFDFFSKLSSEEQKEAARLLNEFLCLIKSED
ncbi:MAG: helix-turn-helix domain-containing protein [Anaerovoracaceae bacterium]